MATAQAEQTAAEANQQAHAGLALAASASVTAAFDLVDVHDLARTLPRFNRAASAVTVRFGQVSAALASAQYVAARREATAAGVIPVSTAPRLALPSPSLSSLEVGLSWATSGLWTPRGQSRDADEQALVSREALAKAQGVVEGAVNTNGRETTFAAVRADRLAQGWARVPEADACPRCLMLAARGPKYRSAETAAFKAHHVQANGTGGECRCGIEVLFSKKWTPSAQVAEAQRVWSESTDGLTGKDAERAFRRAVEGRAESPLVRKTNVPAMRAFTPSPEATARAAAGLRQAIATMRRNNTSGALSAAIKAAEQRLADLAA